MLGRQSENPYQRRRSFLIIVALLFVIATLLLLISRSDNPTFAKPRAAIDSVAAPVLGVLSMPIRGAETMASGVKDRTQIFAENTRLKAELERLRDVDMRAKALELKINRFEEILKTDIVDDIPADKIPARAVTETNGPFVRSALLNVGQIHGVEPGHAVMTTRGLYGHVIRRGKRSSRALLVNDLNSRIAVMSERSGARAILTGDNSNRPVLSFIAPDADWQIGDRIVSSGDEGVLPGGLPVGTVLAQSGKRYTVSLFAFSDPVDWVWIYPYTPIIAPENDPVDADEAAATGGPSGDAGGSGQR